MCIGCDSGAPVNREYKTQFPLAGGKAVKVIYDVGDDIYVDIEHMFATVMARN